MSLFRLSAGHVVAAVAALLLLLVMAMDWYTTDQGESLRRDESLSEPAPGTGVEQRDFERDQQNDLSIAAEQQESIAWQPDGTLGWLALLALVATVIAALAAAALRASNRRFEPPLTPAVITALLATVAAVLVVLGMIDRVGNAGAEIGAGVPLGLLCLAGIAAGSARAARSEQRQAAGAEPAAAAS